MVLVTFELRLLCAVGVLFGVCVSIEKLFHLIYEPTPIIIRNPKSDIDSGIVPRARPPSLRPKQITR